MAHFAQLDSNNIVIQVITINNNDAPDEITGVAFCQSLFGIKTVWKQTSYNTYENKHILGGAPFRKNYAFINHIYDETRDAFYAPSPFPSWKLNEDTCIWEAPTPMPADGKTYEWVEADLNWQVVAPQVG